MTVESFTTLLEQGEVEASAPCRIDMGGTLDLSTFYLPLHSLEPCTFNAALKLRTQVRLSPFEKGKVRIRSRGFEDFVAPSRSAPFNHPLGLMLAVAAYFDADGVTIAIDSSSPPRSALGGSSVAAAALIRAFAKVLAATGRAMPRRSEVALLAHAIEQSVAGVPCGIQDQLAAVYGGVNAWFWTGEPGRAGFRRQEVVPAAACPEFSRSILVAYCGRPHESRDINGTWVRQFVGGKYRDLWRQIVACGHRFVEEVSAGRYDRAGEIMNAETRLRRQMTPDVLDGVGERLVDAAVSHGCGARFTGAGGGGCIWALGEPERIAGLRSVWGKILEGHENACLLDSAIDTDGIL
jgi:D-glycero-alpha-D-manno-heptose-7-phosphate kinase